MRSDFGNLLSCKRPTLEALRVSAFCRGNSVCGSIMPSENALIVRHALRNAGLPVVTLIGFEFGLLVVVEMGFSWPGIGWLVFNAINQIRA